MTTDDWLHIRARMRDRRRGFKSVSNGDVYRGIYWWQDAARTADEDVGDLLDEVERLRALVPLADEPGPSGQ